MFVPTGNANNIVYATCLAHPFKLPFESFNSKVLEHLQCGCCVVLWRDIVALKRARA